MAKEIAASHCNQIAYRCLGANAKLNIFKPHDGFDHGRWVRTFDTRKIALPYKGVSRLARHILSEEETAEVMQKVLGVFRLCMSTRLLAGASAAQIYIFEAQDGFDDRRYICRSCVT